MKFDIREMITRNGRPEHRHVARVQRFDDAITMAAGLAKTRKSESWITVWAMFNGRQAFDVLGVSGIAVSGIAQDVDQKSIDAMAAEARANFPKKRDQYRKQERRHKRVVKWARHWPDGAMSQLHEDTQFKHHLYTKDDFDAAMARARELGIELPAPGQQPTKAAA